VLDALAARGVCATFFVVVTRAEAAPEIVRSVLAAGHEIGLHGLDHRRPTTLAKGAFDGWLREGRRRLEQVCGRAVRWYRPPYGAQSFRTYRAARRSGLDVVVWSADVEDWLDHAPSQIAHLARERVAPGGILLMHDAYQGEPGDDRPPSFDRCEVVDGVLEKLEEENLRPVPIGRLVEASPVHRTAWFRA